jgi:hypothetical protein
MLPPKKNMYYGALLAGTLLQLFWGLLFHRGLTSVNELYPGVDCKCKQELLTK